MLDTKTTISINFTVGTAQESHLRASGADQVDVCRVREPLAVRNADGPIGELQQQPVSALDDRPSLGHTHVTD